jgi:hypothetical protein
MSYRLVTFGDKWYVQSQTGKYFGGYASQRLAETLKQELEAAE